MDGDTSALVLAALQLATAAGIVAFWSWWLRADHDTSWWPEGYAEHEKAFVLPDSVLAALLTISAILTFQDRPVGGQLALLAAGMMLFLALIDLAYFVRNRMFVPERDGVGNALLVGWLLVFAIVLAVANV